MKICIDKIAEVRYTKANGNNSATLNPKEQILVPTGQYFCIGYDKFGKDKGVELYEYED